MRRRLPILAALLAFSGILLVVVVGSSGHRVVQRNVPISGGPGHMERLAFNGRSGVYVFGRGFRATSKATLPRLPGINPFWTAINNQIQEETRQMVAEFKDQVTWTELWSGLRTPSAIRDWEQRITWDAEWVTPQLASLIATYWEYTGGAHGNTGFGALNVLSAGDSFSELSLAELFRTEVDWRSELSGRAAKLINQQKRATGGNDFSEDATANVLPGELDEAVFTISEGGLKLWFAPYEKGAFAEGSFVPLIPYTEIAHLLDTNGPAKWLPCFPSQR